MYFIVVFLEQMENQINYCADEEFNHLDQEQINQHISNGA